MAIYWAVIGSKIHKLSIYQKVDRAPPSRGPNRKHWRLVLNLNLNFRRDMEHCTAKFTAEFSSFGKSAAHFFIIWACHHLQSPGALRDLMNLTKTLTQPLLVLPSVCCRSISFAWLPQHWWQIMCCGPFFFFFHRMDL